MGQKIENKKLSEEETIERKLTERDIIGRLDKAFSTGPGLQEDGLCLYNYMRYKLSGCEGQKDLGITECLETQLKETSHST